MSWMIDWRFDSPVEKRNQWRKTRVTGIKWWMSDDEWRLMSEFFIFSALWHHPSFLILLDSRFFYSISWINPQRLSVGFFSMGFITSPSTVCLIQAQGVETVWKRCVHNMDQNLLPVRLGASKWAQWSTQAQRAVRSKPVSERTSKWD